VSLPDASQLARTYGNSRKKQFGQHFLVDPQILGKICDLGGVKEGARVVEVGPGCGTLTTSMLARGAEVMALEIDRDAAEFLREELSVDGFELIEGDALRFDWSQIQEGTIAVANLPYNVAVDLTFGMLESERFSSLTLMYQREVADRLVARAGDSSYGSLSVMVELWADTRKVMGLPPGAFVPPPKVHSAVVTFKPVQGSRIADKSLHEPFKKLVKTVFEVRRKTMLNGLKRFGVPPETGREALEKAGLDEKIRPERVSFDEFLALTVYLLDEGVISK